MNKRQLRKGGRVVIPEDRRAHVQRTCLAGDRFRGAGGHLIEDVTKTLAEEGTVTDVATQRAMVVFPSLETGIWIEFENLARAVPPPRKGGAR
jgi:hypothetical protein